MGKITKTMQPKHEDTLSDYIRHYVSIACTVQLVHLPSHLETFPHRWPFPRGDLYHWIPLLNRFDGILERFNATYNLSEGPQTRDFGCDILLGKGKSTDPVFHEPLFDMEDLEARGFESDGDRQLVESILQFTRLLLEHCGNRSIYASSAHLNDLLNTTCQTLLIATLEVGTELAKRYQASVKRVNIHSRSVSTALLANHYNMDLERVQQLAAPFVKTPLVSQPAGASTATPASAKSREKASSGSSKSTTSMYANDLVAIVDSDASAWNGWGDVKMTYNATSADVPEARPAVGTDKPGSAMPSTPTPLRRSTTMGGPTQQTPRAGDSSPSAALQSPSISAEGPTSSQGVFDLPQSIVASAPIPDLLRRCPGNLSASAKFELFNRLRVSKALLSDSLARQRALAIRMLAITNLAYIYQESVFMEKVMRTDVDETRQFQLVYQLAELIRPSADGTADVPLWLQAQAMALLEAVSNFPARCQDVLSALNANVNHGILLYVVRKAVAGMKEEDLYQPEEYANEVDEWRSKLFSLTQHLAMSSRIGSEMVAAGLMDVLVEMLKLRTDAAERNHATLLSFIDNLIWTYQNAFQAFFSGDGLDAVADLLVSTVESAKRLADEGAGTPEDLQSTAVDYEIHFFQQQTLKWLLKFMHHMMTNSYSIGGNTDRRLRNLVDKSDLLASLREIMQNTKVFGSVLWTNSVTVLSDFINNDPTSYAAIAESRMITSFLQSITGQPIPETSAPQANVQERTEDDSDDSQSDEGQVTLEPDGRPHPPPEDVLASETRRTVAKGILPNSDAILAVPHVLNSISLNNGGLRMVASSRALEAFFEIFESPDHVDCMNNDNHLGCGIGEHFDELARHHPALRTAISDAVVDMVARVKHLGKMKAKRDGWGTRLIFDTSTGDVVSADSEIIHRLSGSAASMNDPEAEDSDDDSDDDSYDDEMADEPIGTVAARKSARPRTAKANPSAHDTFTPYVHSLAVFLNVFLGNHTMKSNFIHRGGTELLLDIVELPCLPCNFLETRVSTQIYQTISDLVDHSPVLGLPSLLRRAQTAVDCLKPFTEAAEDKRPYFAPFLVSDKPVTLEDTKNWDVATKNQIMQGTAMAKALLNLQSCLKILFRCYGSTPRSPGVHFYPVNVFDYYHDLIRSIGPLLGAVITEVGAILKASPQHWWSYGLSQPTAESRTQEDTVPAPAAAPSENVDGADPAAQFQLLYEGAVGSSSSGGDKVTDIKVKRPSKEEQESARFKNFQTLRTLFHTVVPATAPFLQDAGRALFHRRDKDSYLRYHHTELAKQLSSTVLDQLKSDSASEELRPHQPHSWFAAFHTLTQVLIEARGRPSTAGPVPVQIIVPVYIAFVEQGGLDVITKMARRLAKSIQERLEKDPKSSWLKVYMFGLEKVLGLCSTLINGKIMIDSAAGFTLVTKTQRRDDNQAIANQLVVQARLAILPVLREIWDSPLMEKSQFTMVTRVIDMLKVISTGEYETEAASALALEVLKHEEVSFDWKTHQPVVTQLAQEQNSDDLAREAVYRANGNKSTASEYCRAHKAGRAGARHPIPTRDAYVATSPPTSRPASQQEGSSAAPGGPEPMTVDAPQHELDNLLAQRVLNETEEPMSDSDGSDAMDDATTPAGASTAVPGTEATEAGTASAEAAQVQTRKAELDGQREELRKDLVGRSLDIVRAHSDAAIEVSELINAMILNGRGQEILEDVGTTLSSAITSLAPSDADEAGAADNGKMIAAYAHLFALLLRDAEFLASNLENLRANTGVFVDFLKLAPASSAEELPPWISYILLIVEMLLCHDAKPAHATWKPPTSENDKMQEAVLETPEPIVPPSQQQVLVERILDLLPRLGKDDKLAVSVLRVLVVLTRKPALARTVGAKKNLQRLFVMAKQLAGASVNQLGDTKTAGYIIIILRHIVEDEETIKQVMRSEIRQLFENPQRVQRNLDLSTYLRSLAPVALRSSDLFVEVTNDMVKLNRWSLGSSESSTRSQQLSLRQTATQGSAEHTTKDESVEPAVQATEDLSLHDVKRSTETGDKVMSDAPKPTVQRPVVENPDGVVHFLLCELMNYKEVDDNEAGAPKDAKDTKDSTPHAASSASPAPASSAQPDATEDSTPTPAPASLSQEDKSSKDKKSTKPAFKSEEHPIFIYRCFLLNCLSELLQSYNSSKVEFINFKRSAPLQTNTPVKPRSSALNYLIHDLLCQGVAAENTDSLLAKKKAATSTQASIVLQSLFNSTGEKPAEKHRHNFEYDDDPDLLFVRKFALDTILRAYERASAPEESLDTRYTKMQSLAELMVGIIGEKDKDPHSRGVDSPTARTQAQIRRMMYEKGFLDKLTTSIADLDLTHSSVKRAVKYVLRVLRVLTDTTKELSRSKVIPLGAVPDNADDEIISSSSVSDIDDDREETPDLYRNSALGMLEPRGSDDEYDEDDEDDDEDMYDDEYGDELEYDDEGVSDDGDNNVSDEDEELGDMGEIEGLHGDPGVVEVVMGDDDEDMDEDHDDDISDDDDLDSDDMDDLDDRVVVEEEILDEDGNPIDDDGDEHWEETDDDEDEDIDYEAEAQDGHEMAMQGMGHDQLMDNVLARAVLDHDHEHDFHEHEFEPEDMDDLDDHYLEDGRVDGDDEDEDLDDDIYDEEDYPHDEPPPVHVPGQLGWDTLVVEPFQGSGPRPRHGHRSPFPPGFIAGGGNRDPLGGDYRSFMSRRHRPNPPPNNSDDGVNPLLRRNNEAPDAISRPSGHQGLVGLRLPPEIFGPGAAVRSGFFESPMALLNDLVASLPIGRTHGSQQPIHVSIGGARGETIRVSGAPQAAESRGDARRAGTFQEPQQAVAFSPYATFERYEEEARMIFGGSQYSESAQRLLQVILSKLVPPALEHEKKLRAEEEEKRRAREEERKKREEDEKRAREAKEAEEKAERERQEAERERERVATAAAAAAAENPTPAGTTSATTGQPDAQAMEGVETHGDAARGSGEPAADVPRVVTVIRGEEVDITELGIDPDYLAALPEEFREEVIAQTVSSRRSQAREDAAAGEQTEVFQEFLDALPEEMRSEIVQQERQEIRRRERDEHRRQATGVPSHDVIPTDMDAASILLTFPPELRQQVLLEQGEDLLDQLTPEMAAQVRNSQRPAPGRSTALPPGRTAAQQAEGDDVEQKTQRKTVVQMLDKAGIATLLRLMFISHQNSSIRSYLFGVLADICENRQSRLEVISTVLLILQEGSTDMEAVDRSFGQLSLKARRTKEKEGGDPRTPTQNLKRTLSTYTGNQNTQPRSEISPMVVVNQCLDLLQDLSSHNPHIPMLFLTEHEAVGSSLKRSLSRKGKNKDAKSHKYAINSLLSLLDRELVMQSSDVMAYLADLLNKITVPLATMERRRREAAAKAEEAARKAAAEQGTADSAEPSNQSQQPADPANTAEAASAAAQQPPADANESKDLKVSQDKDAASKKGRQMQPPIVPAHNLELVVKIFVARECSSKTFQNTISAIKNLSAIPGAKVTFGHELVRQAQALSQNIVADLDELLPHILKATSGTEIQGVALAKFSPGASEQNKLLRVLTALDHLFDSKKKNDRSNTEDDAINEKQDLVQSLYQNPTFSQMWEKLGACLGAIRERENMVNIATILLPLIESLMVVCKNTSMTETTPQPQQDKDMVLSSPPPESPMAGLFFNFTEEHRRILNELVRNNPKLMSGTFALLVKNPKVLEFDNKRNYFNRSVHSRANAQRATFPTLQLAVRREHVFHDSFRPLYYKSGDEVKYGKLSIRFHGEEGVDAGGVTREWFQVLARQMFDANYALFTPVSSDRTTFHPNKLSGINDMHLMYFKFVGRIIGKALYEGRVIDCYFSRAVYKRILGKSVSVKDMESFDPDYYKSLVWMLENDITDIITETFSVEDDEFGVTRTIDLCPDGRNIPVTDENKHDYVRLVVEHRLLSSVKEQMEHFLKGFHEIIPRELISIFNEQELELLISGLPDIDIDDWKINSEYHNYNPSSPQIQWFWRAVRSFDKEELAKLLQFVTGTSKVPLNGFKELEGMNGVNRFNIHRDYGNKDRLPSSHTCFNQLDLPEYESYDALRTQLLKAITAGSEYFGFA